MDKVDIKAVAKDVFPQHTERGAYNQLGSKIGLRPLNDKEYEYLKKNKRRPKVDDTLKMESKNIIKLTEQDLHNIVKESVKKIMKEAMNTKPGQFQGGRLAYRKGEQKPIPGQNIGKLRKDPNAPIFNYAEKAAKKAKLGGYGSDFRKGYDYEQTLDDFDNAGSREERLKIAAVNSVLDLLRGIRKGEGPFANGRRLEDFSDEELRDYVKNRMINDYFPKEGV
jgi:hypothetical protein